YETATLAKNLQSSRYMVSILLYPTDQAKLDSYCVKLVDLKRQQQSSEDYVFHTVASFNTVAINRYFTGD
ncbi:unnamed protein product, partial [Calicophoron daubneyi]